MSSTFILILLVLGIGSSSTAGQSTGPYLPPPRQGPSLKDTTEWLEAHLIGVGSRQERTTIDILTSGKKNKPPEELKTIFDHTLSISSAKFENCFLTIVRKGQGDMTTVGSTFTPSTVSTTVYGVPLSKMKDASWTWTYYRPSSPSSAKHKESFNPPARIVIAVNAASDVISWTDQSISRPSNSQDTNSGVASSLFIDTDDVEIAPRLTNAFNHAIQLCQAMAKPEPF